MRRTMGICFGIGTHLLFALTVWRLFFFLKGDVAEPSLTAPALVGIDVLLCLQFAIPHSLLLHPATRQRLSRWIPREFYGCVFCVATCAGLWVTFLGWQSSPSVIWQSKGLGRTAIGLAFVGSWLALFYSLSLQGLGFQTGWTPWWHWLRRLPPPRREFRECGAYRYLRHPIYLSFLGLIWFAPTITLDRAILIATWTAYIAVGSVLKDRRMVHYAGDRYRAYAARVPGYPLMVAGPLGRVAWARDGAAAKPIATRETRPAKKAA